MTKSRLRKLISIIFCFSLIFVSSLCLFSCNTQKLTKEQYRVIFSLAHQCLHEKIVNPPVNQNGTLVDSDYVPYDGDYIELKQPDIMLDFIALILNNNDYQVTNKISTFTIKVDGKFVSGRIKIGRDDDEVYADLVLESENGYQYFGVEVDYNFKYSFLEDIEIKYYNHNGVSLIDFYDYNLNNDFILTVSNYKKNEHQLDALERGQKVRTAKRTDNKNYYFETEHNFALSHNF